MKAGNAKNTARLVLALEIDNQLDLAVLIMKHLGLSDNKVQKDMIDRQLLVPPSSFDI